MAKSSPRRNEFHARKAASPFGINLSRRPRRTMSLTTLDSELVRTLLPSHTNWEERRNKSRFDCFPSELRVMIFKMALHEDWTGKAPALIKALRTEGNVYHDCMVAWYSQDHTYVFHAGNQWSFLDMEPAAIAQITKVKIMIDEQIALHPLLRWEDMRVIKERIPMSLNDLAITASLSTSITSVTLDCRPTTSNLYYWYPQKFFLFFSGFRNLKYAAVTCPIRPRATTAEGGIGPVVRLENGLVSSKWQEKTMANGVLTADEMLGAVAKLDTVYADKYDFAGNRVFRSFEDREKWVWVAEEGKFLKQVVLPEGLKMVRVPERR
ncbi:hypothetical protein VTL71DRAFT_11981 [Oculimacula yallundae]|uniref:Uncharacterized protein n=1 Tax=Oculimacula yallundae TaxID=86028 RepID=A0ABR4CTF3_9HELO